VGTQVWKEISPGGQERVLGVICPSKGKGIIKKKQDNKGRVDVWMPAVAVAFFERLARSKCRFYFPFFLAVT
jgi:hypothetical protein